MYNLHYSLFEPKPTYIIYMKLGTKTCYHQMDIIKQMADRLTVSLKSSASVDKGTSVSLLSL